MQPRKKPATLIINTPNPQTGAPRTLKKLTRHGTPIPSDVQGHRDFTAMMLHEYRWKRNPKEPAGRVTQLNNIGFADIHNQVTRRLQEANPDKKSVDFYQRKKPLAARIKEKK